MRFTRVVLVTVSVAALSFTAGCAGADQQTAPATVTQSAETVTVTVTVPSATTEPAEPVGEYPKVVSRSEIDDRYVAYLDGDEFVMLAPGVYSEMPPDGVLGTREDYSAYFGNCTAIERYSQQYPGGHTCW